RIHATWDRVPPLVGEDNVYVVTGRSHFEQGAQQLPDIPRSKIVTEPSPKDSAAAIGLAAMLIAREDPEAIVGDRMSTRLKSSHVSVSYAVYFLIYKMSSKEVLS